MQQYTLREAEKITGISERTLRRRIKEKILPASLIDGMYYINESDLPRKRNKEMYLPVMQADLPLPMNTSIQDLLASVNAGFKAISDNNAKISEDYKETVLPIVNHAMSAEERQSVEEVLFPIVQGMINNLIALERIPSSNTLAPSQLVEYLTRDTGLPDEIRSLVLEQIKTLYPTPQYSEISA